MYPGVVKVVSDRFLPHVIHDDTVDQLSVLPEVHDEGVRALAFPANPQVCEDNSLVGGKTLGDPVLPCTLIGGVEVEGLSGVVVVNGCLQ